MVDAAVISHRERRPYSFLFLLSFPVGNLLYCSYVLPVAGYLLVTDNDAAKNWVNHFFSPFYFLLSLPLMSDS